MNKGKTIPQDGKGRTNKTKKRESVKPFRHTLLRIIKEKRERESGIEEVREKFKKLRPTPKEE